MNDSVQVFMWQRPGYLRGVCPSGLVSGGRPSDWCTAAASSDLRQSSSEWRLPGGSELRLLQVEQQKDTPAWSPMQSRAEQSRAVSEITSSSLYHIVHLIFSPQILSVKFMPHLASWSVPTMEWKMLCTLLSADSPTMQCVVFYRCENYSFATLQLSNYAAKIITHKRPKSKFTAHNRVKCWVFDI